MIKPHGFSIRTKELRLAVNVDSMDFKPFELNDLKEKKTRTDDLAIGFKSPAGDENYFYISRAKLNRVQRICLELKDSHLL